MDYTYKNNAEFQKIFIELRKSINFCGKRRMSPIQEVPERDSYTDDINISVNYRYCQFINGILQTIRSGDIDYCFYLYQIRDILRHEPNIRCEFIPNGQYFVIRLENKKVGSCE